MLFCYFEEAGKLANFLFYLQRHILVKGCGKAAAAAAAAASAAEADKKEDFNKPTIGEKDNRNADSMPLAGLSEAADDNNNNNNNNNNNVQDLPPPPPQPHQSDASQAAMGVSEVLDNGGS